MTVVGAWDLRRLIGWLVVQWLWHCVGASLRRAQLPTAVRESAILSAAGLPLCEEAAEYHLMRVLRALAVDVCLTQILLAVSEGATMPPLTARLTENGGNTS